MRNLGFAAAALMLLALTAAPTASPTQTAPRADLEMTVAMIHYGTVGNTYYLSYRVVNHSPPTIAHATAVLRLSATAKFLRPFTKGCKGTSQELRCVIGPIRYSSPNGSPCGVGANVPMTAVAPGKLVAKLLVVSANDPNPRNNQQQATAVIHAPQT